MGRDIPIEFGTQSNRGRDGQAGTGRLVNCYSEPAGEEGKSQFPIYAIEGLTRLISETTSTGIRSMLPVDGSIYAVAGQEVFKVKPDGSASTLLGGMPGTTTVYMARNQNPVGPQIALVHEGSAKYIQNDVLTAITDPDLPPPNSVTALGGYFIFTITNGAYYISAQNDIGVNALDFALANQFPDDLKRGLRGLGYLWLFGDRSTEIHANTGNADFPFQILSGGLIEQGILSAASAATVGRVVLWIDHDGTVVAASGSEPARISHHDVERSIAEEPDQSNISGMAYKFRGHEFYEISGTTFTWVCDLTNGARWHEINSWGIAETRSRRERYAKLGNKHYVGDYAEGKIFEIDANANAEDDNAIIWDATTPIIHGGNQRLTHSRLTLDMITGVGLNSSDPNAADPVVEMRYSDDGGKNWSTWRSKRLGKIGQYSTEVRFSKLGQASRKGRSYQVRSSSAVTRGLLGATLRVK